MEYWRIRKRTFNEIIITALLGMLISLGAVLYLLNQISDLNKIIIDLESREPIVMTKFLEIENEEKNQKKVVENIATENKKVYNVSEADREMLAKLLYCEGRGESIECQRAIVSVVFNRLDSGKWGNSLNNVVYAEGQFEPVTTGLLKKAKPSQTQYDAVDYIIKNGVTIPTWVLFFRASYHFNWNGYSPYINIDNTYFGGYTNE